MDGRMVVLLGALVAALVAGGCGEGSRRAAGGDAATFPLSGSIRIDGAGTVSPLTRAIARRFMAEHPDVRITVGRAGNERGFARLCRGQSDIADASEAIDAEAIKACERGDVGWSRVTIANDAVVLLVHRGNPIRCLTTDQLTQIWRGNSAVTEQWTQVGGTVPRHDMELIAWGPGTDTETFAFFTWAVNRERYVTRDYNNSLHRNSHTLGAAAESPGAIGYAAYALYRRKPAPAKLLAVDSGDGCVAPTPATIADGSFRPFARRLFLYPSTEALRRPEVAAFLRFYLERVGPVAQRAGFVPLTGRQLATSRRSLEALIAAAGGPSAGADGR